MIGYYNYTMYLTYASLVSALLGIIISLHGPGHPFIGVYFLLVCGLCDAFDGKVARSKKDRSEEESKFGIQIDSLSDLVAFGVLPACIGDAMLRVSEKVDDVPVFAADERHLYPLFLFAIMAFYALAALIRLGYFNVQEELRQQEEGGVRKTYTGLPVTGAALIFPGILLLQFLTPQDLTLVYFGGLMLTGILFLSPFHIKKPGMRGLMIMVAFGAVEFALLLIFKYWLSTH